jgi:cell division protein FtsQ
MAIKKKIFRVLSIVLWSLALGGVVFVLVSAIQKDQSVFCKEVYVHIDQEKGYKMIDEDEILSALWPATGGSLPKEKTTSSFNLFNLEKQVEKNPWVQAANIYIDQKHRMHIVLKQRTALARVFNTEGNSYYLDSSYLLLPVKSSDIISLPVFTNFYFDPIKLSQEDSSAMSRIVSLSKFIANDSFWMAQIESVNINRDKTFELVTQVGNHRVLLGVRDDWGQLFKKLASLYSFMLETESWDNYALVDLQFKDQIVCTKKGNDPMLQGVGIQNDSLNNMISVADSINLKSDINSNPKIKH